MTTGEPGKADRRQRTWPGLVGPVLHAGAAWAGLWAAFPAGPRAVAVVAAVGAALALWAAGACLEQAAAVLRSTGAAAGGVPAGAGRRPGPAERNWVLAALLAGGLGIGLAIAAGPVPGLCGMGLLAGALAWLRAAGRRPGVAAAVALGGARWLTFLCGAGFRPGGLPAVAWLGLGPAVWAAVAAWLEGAEPGDGEAVETAHLGVLAAAALMAASTLAARTAGPGEPGAAALYLLPALMAVLPHRRRAAAAPGRGVRDAMLGSLWLSLPLADAAAAAAAGGVPAGLPPAVLVAGLLGFRAAAGRVLGRRRPT